MISQMSEEDQELIAFKEAAQREFVERYGKS